MKFLVVLMAAVACQAAPHIAYQVVQGAPVIAHGQSQTSPVVRIPAPGIKFNVPAPAPDSYAAPIVYSFPGPVQVAPPVQVATPVQVAPPVQVATPVHYTSSVHVAPPVQVATPFHYTSPVQVAHTLQHIPGHYTAPVVRTAVVAASPVIYAAAPEPLQAADPPVPSVGVPFVGGQFHAQDEAGQYSFGHWGGPNTRVETRDFLGRITGSFAYVDPVGEVQVRKYAAAPGSGFRVAASDLPLDTPDTPAVAEAKAAHAIAYAAAATAAAA